jgi:CRISPR-associated protein Cst2
MGQNLCSIAFAAKFLLNVHDLNNEAVAGNVADIRLMEFVTKDNKVFTAPAVSGRMLKHFHLAHMTELELSETEPKLCDGCKVGEPIRPARFDNEGKLKELPDISEEKAIENCVICDAHGYLIAQAQALRRNSRAMFSWLVPVLNTEFTSKQSLHSRVSRQIVMRTKTEEERKVQMLFSKSYASGLYGFVSVVNLSGIGYSEGKAQQVLKIDEWRRRTSSAVKAFLPMFTGHMGASLSHALPHTECIELLAVASFSKSVTIPFSPIYENYAEKYLGLFQEKNTIKAYTFGFDAKGAERKNTIGEVLGEILKHISDSNF